MGKCTKIDEVLVNNICISSSEGGCALLLEMQGHKITFTLHIFSGIPNMEFDLAMLYAQTYQQLYLGAPTRVRVTFVMYRGPLPMYGQM